jgi:hypothetical protein
MDLRGVRMGRRLLLPVETMRSILSIHALRRRKKFGSGKKQMPHQDSSAPYSVEISWSPWGLQGRPHGVGTDKQRIIKTDLSVRYIKGHANAEDRSGYVSFSANSLL